MKRKPTEKPGTFASYTFNRGFIYKIYKELKELGKQMTYFKSGLEIWTGSSQKKKNDDEI